MPSAKPVLLVDGHDVPRHSLAEQLAREGAYQVIEAASAQEARAAGNYLFAIIDGEVDDSGGLARELRKSGKPVLLLAEDDKDGPDHLAKPFRLGALLARLSAALGPHGADQDRPVRIGPYLFQPAAKLLTGARKIRLTEKETNILKFLHMAGSTVARDTLLHEVWGYNPAVTTHTLETHIYRLRRKIEENPGEAKILLTEGGGYRLAG
ncbi:MAG TPA: winged helix-turn-helix domain-containing protein [Rhizomicrobium sp.]|nr:winged helix-turn-helix domain-containing protein [Rhizomicrobium sp.]